MAGPSPDGHGVIRPAGGGSTVTGPPGAADIWGDLWSPSRAVTKDADRGQSDDAIHFMAIARNVQ